MLSLSSSASSSSAPPAQRSPTLEADVNNAVAWIQAVRYGANGGFDDLIIRLDSENKALHRRLRSQGDENTALRERMEMLTAELELT